MIGGAGGNQRPLLFVSVAGLSLGYPHRWSLLEQAQHHVDHDGQPDAQKDAGGDRNENVVLAPVE